MALNLSSYYVSHKSWSQATPITSLEPTRCSMIEPRWIRRIELESNNSRVVDGKNNARDKMRVKCASLDVLGVESEKLVGKVTRVCKDTFWPIVRASHDKTLVLDMYPQWCGPCKVMAPKYEKLAQDNLDVIFLKLDRNQENRALAKELGIRVVPTFKILKESKIVNEVIGAKLDELVQAIVYARSC